MAKILIVDDEPSMLIGLKDNLEFESYEVTVAENGEKGLNQLRENQFDLVLLDVMMPIMSGLDVCRMARNEGINTPIIFLTAKSEEIDKVLGLELGADDYITKPFSVRELMARVKAVIRRAGESKAEDKIIGVHQIGNLEVDFTHYEAKLQGEEEKMSHKEYEILAYFLQHQNEVVSRYQLLQDVWGYESQPTTRTVDNFILKLRQRIEDNPNEPKVILTVHGAGYKLIS